MSFRTPPNIRNFTYHGVRTDARSIVIVDDDMVEEAKTAGEKIMADSPVAHAGKTGKKPSVPSFTLEEELALHGAGARALVGVRVGDGRLARLDGDGVDGDGERKLSLR